MSAVYLWISKSSNVGSTKKTPSASIVCLATVARAFQLSFISCATLALNPSYVTGLAFSFSIATALVSVTPDRSAPA